MYTIGQAATRSGVPVDTIRAWERRYGVVRPTRTDSGYRLYDDEAIRTLDVMRRLVAAGWQPSLAAREVRERGLDAAAALVRPASDPRTLEPGPAGVQATTGAPATAPAALPSDRLVARFVDGAARLDEAAIAAMLDDAFALGSFERVADDVLFPALRALGNAWASGAVSVAGEHLASQAVARRLAVALDAAGRLPSGRRRVLVGLPPGGRHDLGAMAFAIAARRAGIPVAYLGPDLPVEDWLSAARTARAAVIGVPTVGDRPAADQVIDRIGAETIGLTVAIGGGGALDRAGVVRLPDRLDEAVDTLRRALAAR